METLSDDEFELISHKNDSDLESEGEGSDHETPSSTPPLASSCPGPSRKTIACPHEGCPKTFNRKARLEEHLRSHTNDRIFKCTYKGCDKDFLRETHLKHHVKSAHTNIRDYECTWEGCDKSFATGTRLRRHLQAHEGREKYRCRGYGDCKETFRKHDTLRRHILQVHEQMRPFPCPDLDPVSGNQCDKAFDTAEKLRAHQRAKHDRTRFSCTECLTAHSLASSNQTKLELEFPPHAFFATYSDLQAHVAEFHPPSCPYCPTSFKTMKELTRHLELQHNIVEAKTSTGQSFSCPHPECGRSFSKKGNLTVHVKTVHEKKKDFICGETQIPLPQDFYNQGDVQVFGCGRAFTTKASLEDHVRTAHLGMTSLQIERRNKRKAEKGVAKIDEAYSESKKRKPRSDKGVKKTSVLAGLTGVSAQDEGKNEVTIDPTLIDDYYSEMKSSKAPSSQVEDHAESDDDENDDWNQLSGSMTLVGTRLYHNGEQYEYTANELSPELSATNLASSQLSECSLNGSYSKITPGIPPAADEEPFFDNFEHEPESMRGTLDPMLTRY